MIYRARLDQVRGELGVVQVYCEAGNLEVAKVIMRHMANRAGERINESYVTEPHFEFVSRVPKGYSVWRAPKGFRVYRHYSHYFMASSDEEADAEIKLTRFSGRSGLEKDFHGEWLAWDHSSNSWRHPSQVKQKYPKGNAADYWSVEQ